jgi:molybdopterin-guanine dinucleotide biosynthesis protein A
LISAPTSLPVSATIPSTDISLGLIAGGRARRLGGVDKAWLQRDGVPQVLRWARRFPGEHGPVLVSANRQLERYAAQRLIAVPDRISEAGPIAGLDALATACTTPWLFTLPVDLVGVNDCLLRTLVSQRGADGAFAEDDDGAQPLVALWRRDALRSACAAALAAGDGAVHRLRQRLDLRAVSFAGLRFGNLNTPEDLRAAGIDPPDTTA